MAKLRFIDNDIVISIAKARISQMMKKNKQAPLETKWQMLGQVSICNGCCCGQPGKGNYEVPLAWLKQEWKYRALLKRVHLSISGCLGPCDVPNVVVITSAKETRWLAGLNQKRHYQLLVDWAEQSKQAGRLLSLPKEFDAHTLAPYRENVAIDKQDDL
jgi:hypothetical protein